MLALVVVMLFAASLLITAALVFDTLVLVGPPLVFAAMYMWSYSTPRARMQIFGLSFYAPYLPWVMLGLSFALGNSILEEVCGIVVGHVCFFLEFASR